jgi:hypothetical protein
MFGHKKIIKIKNNEQPFLPGDWKFLEELVLLSGIRAG